MDFDPIYASTYFKCTPCSDCDVPGYLILVACPPADALWKLQSDQLAEYGRLMARLEQAVAKVTQAERVYILRFSEGTRQVHFHIFPRTTALLEKFRQCNPENRNLTGEAIYGWARLYYRTEALSAKTKETAARLRELLNKHDDSVTHSRDLRNRLKGAFNDTYSFERPELREETRKFSPFIWMPAVVLFLCKFLWGVELVRFLARGVWSQPDRVEVHPAVSDAYILVMALLTFAGVFALGFGLFDAPYLTVVYALWRIFEDVGSSFHALVTRAVFGGRKSRSEFRYLVATIIRSAEVWAALILLWGVERSLLILPTQHGPAEVATMLQVAYFVTTSVTTVGYGDIVPNAAAPVALVLAIVTQFVAVAMITMLVAKALSLVSPQFGPVR
jgi:diadenosine tetraphosphate (Ap4A) HIT family hydrolase